MISLNNRYTSVDAQESDYKIACQNALILEAEIETCHKAIESLMECYDKLEADKSELLEGLMSAVDIYRFVTGNNLYELESIIDRHAAKEEK